MDFADRESRRFIAKTLGEELRRAREAHDWSRMQFVKRLPSGIGERTLLAYEHGLRDLAVVRFLELCHSLGVDASSLLNHSLQRAQVLLENAVLRIDLRMLIEDRRPQFRSMSQWARNKLSRYSDGVAELAPTAVDEFADFMGCDHEDLRLHLARFIPDFDYTPEG
jgi:transcriptional regulator with XRE-family HTH domain